MGVVRYLASFWARPSAGLAAPRAGTTPTRRRRGRTAALPTSKLRWFLADVERAVRLAETGDMSLAAQLYRALRRDGTIHGLLSTRTGGLVRMRRRFDGDPEVKQALEGTAHVAATFDELFPPAELALLAADGIVLGVGVGEMVPVYETRGDIEVVVGHVLRRLEPEFLHYDWSEDAWFYNANLGRLRITPGDGRWILHCPGGQAEPWTHGLWASLGRGYVEKEHALLHRANYAAKLANPARVAVSPQGASEGQKQSWFRQVMGWGVNTVFGMTPGYDVKLLESNGRGFEVFDKIIGTSDREAMIAIVGSTVMVDGGTGFSNQDVHASVRADLIKETGDALSYTLNTQAIPPWANRAFGACRTATVHYDTTPAKNMKAEADSLSAAAKAIEDLSRALQPFGLAPNAVEIASAFGVPIDGDLNGDARPDALAGAPEGAPTVEAPLEDADVRRLADKMTEFRVERCEHGRANRCWLCGVERVRDFTRGAGGAAAWSVAWRPIGQAKTAPQLPAAQMEAA